MELKQLRYVHAAACQFKPNKMYSLDEVKKVIKSDKVIKEMFEPINFEWEEEKVDKADISKLKNKYNVRK